MPLDCSLWFQGKNDKPLCRKAQGVISLSRQKFILKGKEFEEEGAGSNYLVVSTRQNNHPTKIQLNRIRTVLHKMANQGKATIEFEEPRLSLFIAEAKPEHLRKFLAQLENGRNGQPVKSAQLGSNPASAIGNRPTKMRIQSSQDYPRQGTSNGFPSTLQVLLLYNIGLKAVDSRWFNLRSLCHLSLENNKLGKDWTRLSWRRFCAISRLENLTELNLSGNSFINIPDEFIDSLPKLAVLLLANCQLRRLSNRISRLQNLHVLSLSQNPMEELPEDLCLLPNLRKLYLSCMPNLRFLPATIFHNSSNINKFSELDVSSNNMSPFANPALEPENKEREKKFLSLGMLAAAALLNNPQYLEPDDSRLLRPPIRDCLPQLVHKQMRQWLLRCAQCQRLYPPQSCRSQSEHFHRVQLRSFVSSTLIGPSPALVRLQLCSTCPKPSTRLFRRHNLPVHAPVAIPPPPPPILNLHL